MLHAWPQVTKALGNGLRADVWVQFQARFHIPTICEFYGSTEGPLATTNNQNKVGAVG
jgi:fatty-acyl-CoA synthase